MGILGFSNEAKIQMIPKLEGMTPFFARAGSAHSGTCVHISTQNQAL